VIHLRLQAVEVHAQASLAFWQRELAMIEFEQFQVDLIVGNVLYIDNFRGNVPVKQNVDDFLPVIILC
jgi:hypothetical protein